MSDKSLIKFESLELKSLLAASYFMSSNTNNIAIIEPEIVDNKFTILLSIIVFPFTNLFLVL